MEGSECTTCLMLPTSCFRLQGHCLRLHKDELLPLFLRHPVHIGQNERMSGASAHTGGHIELMAAVAFHRYVLFLIPGDNAEGAGHDAGPASDAPLLSAAHEHLVVTVQATADASVKARCVLA